METFIFMKELEAVRARQEEDLTRDISDVILKKVINDIEKNYINVNEIKYLYFYSVSNDFFGKSYSLGYAYSSNPDEDEKIEKGYTNNNLHPIGKYGDVSKCVLQSFVKKLKERLKNEGAIIVKAPFQDSFKIKLKK